MKISYIISFVLIINFAFASSNEWKKVFSKDDVEVFAYQSEEKLIPFKATAIIDANLEMVLSTLKDHSKKHLWSPKLKSVKIHQKISDQSFIFSEYYKTPWPATDREFLLKGTINRIGQDKVVLKAASIDNEDLKNENHIQANVKNLEVILEKISHNQTKIQFEFHGDMKGWMPIWLVNIIQKKWPYRFILALKKQIQLNEVNNPKLSKK